MRPYEASVLIGDTTPNLPPPDKGGCGFLQILVIVIAVVVAVFAPQFIAPLVNSIGLSGALANVVTGALTMAVSSIVSQGVAMALGIQDKFSWKQVGQAAISGGITGGLSGVGFTNSALNSVSNAAARAAVSNALGQGISIAVGLQERFSWVGVAAAGAGGAVGQYVGNSLQTADAFKDLGQFGASLARGTVRGFAAGLTTAALGGGRVSVVQVATDAFGNALGESIAQANWSGSQQERTPGKTFTEDVAARKAANYWNPAPDQPLRVANSGLIFNDLGSPYGDVSFGEPLMPTATSDAVFNALVDGMRNSLPVAGPRIVLDDFGNPASIGQGQDADVQYRGRKATLDDIATYQSTEEEMARLKFNKIFRPDDSNHYVIGSFLDGTWNKRGDGGLGDFRPGIDSTNVGLLQWMSEGQSDNFRTKYFEGVGTDWYTKHFGGATGAGMTLRVEDAYKWTADQVNTIYASNREATFDFLGAGFSRGSVETRMLLRTLDARGIPDYSTRYEVEIAEGRTEVRYDRQLIEPGHANLNAVLFDSVSTGVGDFYNLDLPRRAQVYHPVARDEMRSLFPSAPLARPGEALSLSWYQPILAGDHSDIGNNHDRGGLGDWNLKLAHQFMTQQLGLPLPAIPGMYTPNPGNMWIHDMSGRQGVAPLDNSPFVRPLAPRYAPPQRLPTYGG